MNRFKSALCRLVCLLLLPFLAACGGNTEQTKEPIDPLVLGRTIYIKRCVSCHNHDGTGTLRKKPYAADFNRSDGVLQQSDEVLLAAVMDGKKGSYGTMPAFRPILKENEVRAVLAYIRRQFHTPPTPEDVSTVRSP